MSPPQMRCVLFSPNCWWLVVTFVVVFAFLPETFGKVAGTYEWYFVIL